MNFKLDKKKLASLIKEEVIREVYDRPFYVAPASRTPMEDKELAWQDILLEKISELLEEGLAFGGFYKVETTDAPNTNGKILIGPASPAPTHVAEGEEE